MRRRGRGACRLVAMVLGVALAAVLAGLSGAGTGGSSAQEPSGVIGGSVRSNSGAPIGGAVVLAYGWDTRLLLGEARTLDDGTYRLGVPGVARYLVRAEAGGCVPQYFREGAVEPVTATSCGATDNIDFILTPGTTISGRVCQAGGQTAIEGARVTAYRESADTWQPVLDCLSGADGRYSLTPGTESGTYRVRAEAAGYAGAYYVSVPDPVEVTDVYVSGGQHIGDISFNLSPTGFISGTVYGSGGLVPVASAEIAAYDNATGQWAGSGLSDARAGAYFINLPPGAYRLRAQAPGHLLQWYGGAGTYGGAAAVSVAGLDGEADIDFTLESGTGVATFPARAAGTSARLVGQVTSMGAASEVMVSFVWGTATGYYPFQTPEAVRAGPGYFWSDVDGLVPGNRYYYRARAMGGESWVYGEEMSYQPVDVTPPVLLRLRCDAEGREARFTWTSDEPAIFQIDFGPTQDYASSTGPSADMAADSTVYLVDLDPDTTYHYRVILRDRWGNKAVSGDRTFSTTAYYGGMAGQGWKIAGFAVVGVLGLVLCFVWVKSR